jgi:hypothetical protein
VFCDETEEIRLASSDIDHFDAHDDRRLIAPFVQI